MDIVCALYIGHQDYLGDKPDLSEEDSHYQWATLVDEMFRRISGKREASSLALGQFALVVPDDSSELSATMTYGGSNFVARGFTTETATADDQPGAPVLYYLNAHFPVPEELEDEIIELEDIGELDEHLEVVFLVLGKQIAFIGVPELSFD